MEPQAASLGKSSCASSTTFQGDVSRQWPEHIETGSYFPLWIEL